MEPARQLESNDTKRVILDSAINAFGKYGYKKTSMEDIAALAGISKQGIYLHFSGKKEIFSTSILHYLETGLSLVDEALKGDDKLLRRVTRALDTWFGRHYETFSANSFDIIELGNELATDKVDYYKESFRRRLEAALDSSEEFKNSQNICSAKEVSQALFLAGLSWKENHFSSRKEFMKSLAVSIRCCCQIGS